MKEEMFYKNGNSYKLENIGHFIYRNGMELWYISQNQFNKKLKKMASVWKIPNFIIRIECCIILYSLTIVWVLLWQRNTVGPLF